MFQHVVNKLQRGPTIKLMVSVIKCSRTNTQTTTSPIYVDDLAVVVLIFDSKSTNVNGTEHLEVRVKVKKNENVKKPTVLVSVEYEEFNKRFYCSDLWIEHKMKDARRSSCVQYNNGLAVNMYVLEVNITVLDDEPVPLKNDKLYHDEEFTDFELCAADGSVAVHKAILFIHSEMFRTMLRGEWKETAEGRVSVEGVTARTLRHLKDYMYLGALPDEGLEPLLQLAARYFMDNLKAACVAKLAKSVKPENFDDLVQLACQCNVPELVRALVLEIPDDILNTIHQSKTKKKEANDNKLNKLS